MKWIHVFMLNSLLVLMVACNDDNISSSIVKIFSTNNVHAWTGIDANSKDLAGKCSIVGSNVVYTRVNMDYTGIDECNWADADVGDYYKIDFSSSSPQLEAVFPSAR